jgi:hypothetical protein
LFTVLHKEINGLIALSTVLIPSDFAVLCCMKKAKRMPTMYGVFLGVCWQVNVTIPSPGVKVVVNEVDCPWVIVEVSHDTGQAARQDQK